MIFETKKKADGVNVREGVTSHKAPLTGGQGGAFGQWPPTAGPALGVWHSGGGGFAGG